MGGSTWKEIQLRTSDEDGKGVHGGAGSTIFAKLTAGVVQLFSVLSSGKIVQITGGDEEAPNVASGALDTIGLETLDDAADPLVMTLADPGVAGKRLVITQKDSGTQGHTVTTASAGGFDGTNNTATFNAQFETLELYSVSSTRWVIIANVDAVALTAV